ncbi:hypothetical protein RirG_167890 [Rhizophagus irregularis DAOM 197198w]|uniref:Uncharacterized protein n=1 Tax=Rhizophagus irregularis (strain DAOM 197198w) TaxID=1432141 RepID=A0A015IWZ9_RHIIW|nr:hypothetical protein RirG_167890 [Rhizophagus irregularis DAOM 197198w]
MDFFLQLPKEKMDILLIQFMHFNIMINLKSLNMIVVVHQFHKNYISVCVVIYAANIFRLSIIPLNFNVAEDIIQRNPWQEIEQDVREVQSDRE